MATEKIINSFASIVPSHIRQRMLLNARHVVCLTERKENSVFPPKPLSASNFVHAVRELDTIEDDVNMQQIKEDEAHYHELLHMLVRLSHDDQETFAKLMNKQDISNKPIDR
jgi:bifunctional DNA-binding transcriptional regulator/antitoxin component of YhaV-PrlF toxin-antitoxin module